MAQSTQAASTAIGPGPHNRPLTAGGWELQAGRLGLAMFSIALAFPAVGLLRIASAEDLEGTRQLLVGSLAATALALVVGLVVWRSLSWGQPWSVVAVAIPIALVLIPATLFDMGGLWGYPFAIALRAAAVVFFGGALLLVARSVLGLWGARPHRFLEARLATGASWRHAARHEWAKATEMGQQAVGFCPECPDTHAALAFAHWAAGDADKAVAAYEFGLALCPDAPILLGDLGVLYTRTGQYTEALSCYERMVELGLNTAELRYDLSLVYAHQGRTEEARAQVREALALSPQEERFEQFLRELGET